MTQNVTAPFDYSRPVVINTFKVTNPDQPAAESPETEAALQLFDEGLAQFYAGNYRGALTQFDAALRQLPGDPVVHEVRALALFALGDFQSAAAALNSLLATAPGMDWTTMAGLYGNVEDYTTQLRALEAHVNANPNDAAARFVLAYHYLVTGHHDAAVVRLREVVALQPRDVVARKILTALDPEAPAPATTPAATPTEPSAASDEETDLVGEWKATADKTTIRLVVDEDFGFVWSAATAGAESAEIQGEIDIDEDLLILDGGEQGAMAGEVVSEGPNRFRFTLEGSSARGADNFLTFERVGK